MLELSQLNLELAFASSRPLSKNIQNQRRAIQHFAVKNFFEISALSRREFLIKNNRINVGFPAVLGKFIRFTFTDKRPGARSHHFLLAIANDLASGGDRQFGEFVQGFSYPISIAGLRLEADKQYSQCY